MNYYYDIFISVESLFEWRLLNHNRSPLFDCIRFTRVCFIYCFCHFGLPSPPREYFDIAISFVHKIIWKNLLRFRPERFGCHEYILVPSCSSCDMRSVKFVMFKVVSSCKNRVGLFFNWAKCPEHDFDLWGVSIFQAKNHLLSSVTGWICGPFASENVSRRKLSLSHFYAIALWRFFFVVSLASKINEHGRANFTPEHNIYCFASFCRSRVLSRSFAMWGGNIDGAIKYTRRCSNRRREGWERGRGNSDNLVDYLKFSSRLRNAE